MRGRHVPLVFKRVPAAHFLQEIHHLLRTWARVCLLIPAALHQLAKRRRRDAIGAGVEVRALGGRAHKLLTGSLVEWETPGAQGP
jgi:hypothetical protein